MQEPGLLSAELCRKHGLSPVAFCQRMAKANPADDLRAYTDARFARCHAALPGFPRRVAVLSGGLRAAPQGCPQRQRGSFINPRTME